jgi:hypothetical protein
MKFTAEIFLKSNSCLAEKKLHPHYKDYSGNAVTDRIAVHCEKRTESTNTPRWGGGELGGNDC